MESALGDAGTVSLVLMVVRRARIIFLTTARPFPVGRSVCPSSIIICLWHGGNVD